MALDPELDAMSQVFESLKDLDKKGIKRIIHWVKDRFCLTGVRPADELTIQPVQGETVVIRTGTRTEPMVKTVEKTTGKKDLIHYDTVLDLFSESNVKKVTAKILLMAAYLQERNNFKEISSYDINFRLKRIGHGVPNISSLINGILRKKPPLLVQLDSESTSKQSRRKFTVSEEGLKLARSYIKGE